MNLDYLHEFIVLCKSKSLNSASRKLSLAPSTLSRHMSDIERTLNATLLERGAKSIELTYTGEIFLEGACFIFDYYQELSNRIQTAKAMQDTPLTIGGHLRVGGIGRLAASTIALASRGHLPVKPRIYEPHNSTVFATLASNDPMETLQAGLVDIVIMSTDVSHERNDLSSCFLYKDTFVVFLHEKHPLAKQNEPVALSNLRDLTLVVTNYYPDQHKCIVEVFKKAGVAIKTKTKIFNSIGDQFVARNLDEMFIVSKSSAYKVPSQNITGLKELSVNDEIAFFDVTALWIKENENTSIECFVDALKQAALTIP